MCPCPQSERSFVLRGMVALALVGLGMLGAAAQGASVLQRAREAFAAYEKETAAKETALAQGRFNEVGSHETAARKALLDAKAAYDEAGAPGSLDKEEIFRYGTVLEQLGYDDLRGEAMERAVTLAPEDARAWAELGAAKIACGPKHEVRGLEALRKSLALDATSKESAVAQTALGKLYYAQGLYDLSREALEKAVALAPANAEAVIRLAALQVRAGKIAEANAAIDALGQAARPYDATTRVLLRDCLETYENDGRYFDDTASNHVAFAKLLYRAGRLPEAVLAGSRAVRLDPKDTKTLNLIGSIYMQIGNGDGARQSYEKSLEADPNQPDVAAVIQKLKEQAATQPAPAAAPAPPAAP